MQRVIVDIVDNGSAGWLVTMTHCGGGADGADLRICVDRAMACVEVSLQVSEVQSTTLKVPASPTLEVEQIGAMLEWLLPGSARDAPTWLDPSTYGSWLHTALFGSDDSDLWPQTEEIGKNGGGLELAMRWAADDPSLNRLMWEAMYVPPVPDAPVGAASEALAGFRRPRPLVAVTRLVTPMAPASIPLPFAGIPRVLFVMGSSFDDEHVRPGAMLLGLLRSFDARGLCVSRVRLDIGVDELKRECERFHPQVIHIVAHGRMDRRTGEVSITLRRDDDVRHDKLLDAIGSPAALFLSVCESGAVAVTSAVPVSAGMQQASLAARLVEGGIPIVAAMAGRVGVSACRLFIRQLVDAVANGTGLVEAAAKGRRAALLGSVQESVNLDWAMPALFLNDNLGPDTQVLDLRVAILANGTVKAMELPRQPSFVGRDSMLLAVDEMVNPSAPDDRRISFFAITNSVGLTDLGSTRLLREMSCRLVRAGHVPILLTTAGGATSPATFSELISDLFKQIDQVRYDLGLSRRWSSILGPEPPQFDATTLTSALNEYRNASNSHPHDVRDKLVEEIGKLLVEVRQMPEPFGTHSMAVVLGDEVDQWGDGLTGILDMVGVGGIGSWSALRPGDLRIPLVVTATTSGAGEALNNAAPRLRASNGKFEELKEFNPTEALAAYHWTLLQPWQDAAESENSQPSFGQAVQPGRQAFVVVEGQSVKWDQALMSLTPHLPRNLTTKLYDAANVALAFEVIRRIDADDDAALTSYDSGAT